MNAQLALDFSAPAPTYGCGTVAEAFWSQVRKTDGCWLWTGMIKCGFRGGLFTFHRKRHPVHRVSWEMANGAVPSGSLVFHSCETPNCVRPDHLFLGERKRCAANARKHKKSGPRPIVTNYRGCNTCFDTITWSRPATGCPECKQPWLPEDVTDMRQECRERTVSRWVEPDLDHDQETVAKILKRSAIVNELKNQGYNGRTQKARDLTGQTLAGCLVTGRAAALKREPWWLITASCQHPDAIEGWLLQRLEAEGRHHLCAACRSKQGIRKRAGVAPSELEAKL